MKRRMINVLATVFFVLGGAAWAATRTVVLAVPGMTCPVCPITVKKALERVPGVQRISVNYRRKQVRVTYDDARTNVAALEKATADAGYPSSVKKA